jgi:hypothetical protein
VRKPKVKLPKRSNKGKYDDRATLKGRHFVAEILKHQTRHCRPKFQ